MSSSSSSSATTSRPAARRRRTCAQVVGALGAVLGLFAIAAEAPAQLVRLGAGVDLRVGRNYAPRGVFGGCNGGGYGAYSLPTAPQAYIPSAGSYYAPPAAPPAIFDGGGYYRPAFESSSYAPRIQIIIEHAAPSWPSCSSSAAYAPWAPSWPAGLSAPPRIFEGRGVPPN